MRRLLVLMLATWPAVAAARPSWKTVVENPGVVRDRVLVARYGNAGVTPATMTPSDHGSPGASPVAYPLVQETTDRLRILVEHEDARLLLWIDRADAAWTVARPTLVLGTADAGVWALPGAALTISGDGGRVAVHLADDDVALDGTIARSALRHRYRPSPPPREGTHSVRTIARAPDGPPLVTGDQPIGVTVRAGGVPGWALVEHRSGQVRVVGWARTSELSDELSLSLGTGGGFGYGMSDTDRVMLDAGACLFDEQGAIVGVQTARGQRYAYDLGGGRWSVYVGTNWGLHTAYVQDRNRGQGDAAWARCR
ncbi:MAG: hypothetical protein JNK64_17070 [Myxococcales bacterium]|nr:hypothetical protein [Myxococcales bacterium]